MITLSSERSRLCLHEIFSFVCRCGLCVVSRLGYRHCAWFGCTASRGLWDSKAVALALAVVRQASMHLAILILPLNTRKLGLFKQLSCFQKKYKMVPLRQISPRDTVGTTGIWSGPFNLLSFVWVEGGEHEVHSLPECSI